MEQSIESDLANDVVQWSPYAFLLRLLCVVSFPLMVRYAVQVQASFAATIWSGIRHGFAESKEGERSAFVDESAKVTVIIPAYNEQVGIVKMIESVLSNDYANLTILVVNDGSTDLTHEKVMDFCECADYSHQQGKNAIRYLRLPNGGKANALNEALQTLDSDTDIVVTIDADCIMHSDAIREFVRAFENDPNVGGVAGNVVVANHSTMIGRMQQLEYVMTFFNKRGNSFLGGSVYIIGGAAAAYRKDVIDELGFFDLSIIAEDVEFSTRILSRNYKTRYVPNAVVYTEGPSDWIGLANQRLRWRYGRLLTFIKHRSLFFSLRNHNVYLCWFLLPLTVYSDLLTVCLPFLGLPCITLYSLVVDSKPLLILCLTKCPPWLWPRFSLTEIERITHFGLSVHPLRGRFLW